MRRVFVDTSAILALLNPADAHHEAAKRVFSKLQSEAAPLITTSYVLVETYALLARRMGLEAVEAFRADMAPLIDVVWVDQELHEKGLDVQLSRGQKRLSLVDVVSFLAIRQHRIDHVFGFDQHFDKEGIPRVA